MTNLTLNSFFYMFISILYMFRATSCLLSGESIVSIHLVCVSLCSWLSSMQVGENLRTRRSPTQSDTYQTLYWYNWFSWWWAWGCSKHVVNWNKHTEKGIVRQVGHLQERYQAFYVICSSAQISPWNRLMTGTLECWKDKFWKLRIRKIEF
jgi:hypothetical protein